MKTNFQFVNEGQGGGGKEVVGVAVATLFASLMEPPDDLFLLPSLFFLSWLGQLGGLGGDHWRNSQRIPFEPSGIPVGPSGTFQNPKNSIRTLMKPTEP